MTRSPGKANKPPTHPCRGGEREPSFLRLCHTCLALSESPSPTETRKKYFPAEATFSSHRIFVCQEFFLWPASCLMAREKFFSATLLVVGLSACTYVRRYLPVGMAGYMNSQSSCLLLSCVSFVLIKMARLSLSPPSSSFASHSRPHLSFLFSTLQFGRRRRQRRTRKERVLLCQG